MPPDPLLTPQADPRQAVRLRRLGLAALTYALTATFVALAWLFGMLPGLAALQVLAAYLAINLGLYAAIRSGFNLRFKDPSLTRFQILVGITMVMAIVYNMDDGRELALFGCFLVFLFGIFRLSAREFVGITLYTLLGYAVVIALLVHLRPAAIPDVPREIMSWLLLAGFLPCFNIIGGQFNRLRRKLRENVESLRVFADNIPAMTVSWDENLRCRLANRVFSEFFGLAPDAIVGQHVRTVLGEVMYRELEGHFAQVLQGYPVTYGSVSLLPSGESRYLEVRVVPYIDSEEKIAGGFSVITDITGHKLAEERIQWVAHHDSLTSLPNRLLFGDRLGQAVRVAKRNNLSFALLYLDLDRFKPVNDTLGHGAGDELLVDVSRRIQGVVRESDTVARVGGDEFALLLLDVAGRGEAEVVAAKITAALVAPFRVGSARHEVTIGTSIGIAIFPTDASDPDALVKAADAAMYDAKQVRDGCLAGERKPGRLLGVAA